MMTVSSGLHLIPPDARRAGLVVVAAQDPGLYALCAGFAAQGYEVMVPEMAGVAAAVEALSGPVVMLSLGSGAAVALDVAKRMPKVAAISLFDPPADKLDLDVDGAVIVHIAIGEVGGSTLDMDRLRARWPELVVYPYRTEPGFIYGATDPAQLARLRTLQLFHRAGGKAEMGG